MLQSGFHSAMRTEKYSKLEFTNAVIENGRLPLFKLFKMEENCIPCNPKLAMKKHQKKSEMFANVAGKNFAQQKIVTGKSGCMGTSIVLELMHKENVVDGLGHLVLLGH